MKASIFLSILFAGSFLLACGGPATTIDPELQSKAEALLVEGMREAVCDSAVLLVLESTTGQVKVRTKMVSDFASGSYVSVPESRMDTRVEPGGILLPITVMGAMDEAGYTLSDPVDAGNGRLVMHQRTIYDQDVFDKGGYGLINLGLCVTLPSFVGATQMMEWAYNGKGERFEKRMKSMSLGQPGDEDPFDQTPGFEARMNALSLGYYFRLSPDQMMAAWNGLANHGRMMKPVLVPADTTVINPAMAKPETVSAMRRLLMENGKKEYPDRSDLAFLKAVNSIKTKYVREVTGTFCGWYPAEQPRYTFLMILYHSESPDSDEQKGKSALMEVGKRMVAELMSATR